MEPRPGLEPGTCGFPARYEAAALPTELPGLVVVSFLGFYVFFAE